MGVEPGVEATANEPVCVRMTIGGGMTFDVDLPATIPVN